MILSSRISISNQILLEKNIMKKENQSSFFSFFISSIFEFLLYECPGLCQLQGMDKVKNKVA